MNIAIITGASGGLGAEYVRQLDAAGCYHEIWGIARRRELLEAMRDEIKTPFRPIPLDLTDPASLQTLAKLMEKEKPDIRVLVNAAGFGKIGSYRDITPEQCCRMIDLNCKAAVMLTQAALPYMHSGSCILEICSTASFQPFPYLNVYSASKSFLYRYARSLGRELQGTGISVTAVCPYWIRDTDFIDTAKRTKDSHYIDNFAFATYKKDVVRRSLRTAARGRSVSTPGFACTLHRILAKFTPYGILMRLWDPFRRL